MARQKLDKTNAMRLLDQRRVAYETLAYDPAIHSAVEVADALGVPRSGCTRRSSCSTRRPAAGRCW